MVCPNCGGESHGIDECPYCFWTPGEELFKPHFMDEATWREGLAVNWGPPGKKKSVKKR